MLKKFSLVKFAGADLPARTIRARITDETVDRSGDIVVASGCDASNFEKNPVVLWQHSTDRPIARAKLFPTAGAIDAQIEFPEAGVSAQADEAFNLVKAGVLGAVSIGFSSIEQSPLPAGGTRFSKWELLEISLVSIPANPNALVTQKSMSAPTTLAEKAKAALDKAERWHVEALDAVNDVKFGEMSASQALTQIWDAVTKARAHADVATDLITKLRDLPGTDSSADAELAFNPRRRKAALAALDARDVGRAPAPSVTPQVLGGAYAVAAYREQELQRLRAVSNALDAAAAAKARGQ